MVAAFRNLQIGVMFRRQLHSLRRYQIDERLMRFRQMQMHRIHHFAERMRTGHGQHFRVDLLHDILARRVLLAAEAASDDDLAVLIQRLADRVERFLDRSVNEPASIHDHEIRTVIRLRRFIALGAQLREDLLGINQRLGATQ